MDTIIATLLVLVLANLIHLEVQSALNRRDIKELKRKFLIGDFPERSEK